jgi:hypothetical protein
MPKKSRRKKNKTHSPMAKAVGTKKAKSKPKRRKNRASVAKKMLKPSTPIATRMGIAGATVSMLSEGVADTGCLPYPLAEALVYKCGSPEADGVPSSTPLGSLFGGARLTGFCQCVANGVPCSPSKVPCSGGKTLQDVIDAIACK